MTNQATNAGVVLIGTNFDPSRLSIDYLRLKKLIPEEWKPLGTPIVSPVVSAINFEDGTQLLAQQNRFQAMHVGLGFDPLTTHVERIALGYVENNQGIQCTNIGLNFQGAYPQSDTNAFLVERFSLPAQKIAKLTLEKTEALSFSSQRKGARLNFSVKAGKQPTTSNPDQSVIVVDFNYDCQLTTTTNSADALKAIERFQEAWKDYSNIVSILLGDKS